MTPASVELSSLMVVAALRFAMASIAASTSLWWLRLLRTAG